jgi:hypothetical protein
MRLPRVKFKVKQVLCAMAIISLLPGFISARVTPENWPPWVILTVVCASPSLWMVCVLAEILSPEWRRKEQGPLASSAVVSSRCPRFTVLQLMLAMAAVTLMCWFAAMLAPFWWRAFHMPTNAEIAEGLRLDAAHWTRLAADNPGLAKDYQRLADRLIRSADRLERRAKGNPPDHP